MNIGQFENGENGRISGELHVLPVGRVKLTFMPAGRGADYVITMTETGTEVGAGWKKTGKESGKPYISVRLDSPFLSEPLNVALFPAKEPGRHVMVWDRPRANAEAEPGRTAA
jgi:uncharacterized protein (DUF736 family)